MSDRSLHTVLITGAGRGIGHAIACRLAATGYSLALVSRSADALAETARVCTQARPDLAIATAALDVGREDHVAQIPPLLNELPPLLAVANNAGTGTWKALEDTPVDSWDHQIRTNLRGPFLVTRATLPILKAHGRGIYVNIASDSALVGQATRAAYNASKHGLVGMTLALRAELHDTAIAASLVYVGPTDTYFRQHHPGDRPGSLHPDTVATAVTFIIEQYPTALITELSVLPAHSGIIGQRSLP